MGVGLLSLLADEDYMEDAASEAVGFAAACLAFSLAAAAASSSLAFCSLAILSAACLRIASTIGVGLLSEAAGELLLVAAP